MNWRILLLAIVTLDFAILSGWAIAQVGYVGLFEAVLDNPGGIQVFADLAIMGTLVVVWMVADARKQGLTVWPFVLMTLSLGSFGPLAYLLRREFSRSESPLAAGTPRPA